jgi:hypothetical protein
VLRYEHGAVRHRVSVDGATMPRDDELPPALGELGLRNAAPVRTGPDFHRNMDRVIAPLSTGFDSRSRERVAEPSLRRHGKRNRGRRRGAQRNLCSPGAA